MTIDVKLDHMTLGTAMIITVIILFVTVTVFIANWPRNPPDA